MTATQEQKSNIKVSHIVITFIASVIITAQSSINSELNLFTEYPLVTAIINFATGLLILSEQ